MVISFYPRDIPGIFFVLYGGLVFLVYDKSNVS